VRNVRQFLDERLVRRPYRLVHRLGGVADLPPLLVGEGLAQLGLDSAYDRRRALRPRAATFRADILAARSAGLVGRHSPRRTGHAPGSRAAHRTAATRCHCGQAEAYRNTCR
jgi:hypothetical protein